MIVYAPGDGPFMVAGDSQLAAVVALDWLRGGEPFAQLVDETIAVLVRVDERISALSVNVDGESFSDEAQLVRVHALVSRAAMVDLERLRRMGTSTPDLVRLAVWYTFLTTRQLTLDLSGAA